MAASTNARVMDMVRKELEKDPTIKSQELFEKAKKLDSGLGSLSIRQFHASYPLQVKRLSKKGPGRAKPGRRAAVKTAASRAPSKPTGRPRGRPRKNAVPAPDAAAPVASTRPGGSRAANGSDREAVRSLLMQFAGEVAGAENRAQVVHVMGKIDTWVDRVLKAANA